MTDDARFQDYLGASNRYFAAEQAWISQIRVK